MGSYAITSVKLSLSDGYVTSYAVAGKREIRPYGHPTQQRILCKTVTF